MPDDNLQAPFAELENQLRKLETIADPACRSVTTELLASVLRFHTTALERMLQLIQNSEAAGAILAGLDRDPLIRSMLLVHDLHPESVSMRVRRAVAELEPYLQKREAKLEIITIEEDCVRIKVTAGSHGGPVGATIEQAIRNAAPEVEQVIFEESGGSGAGFVPLEALQHPLPAAAAGTNEK
jgi:hypothetical protein